MDSFDIVALTKTWLDYDFNDRELHLEGYSTFRRDRCVRRSGGVLLTIKPHIPCVRRCDLEVDAEMLVCELRTSNTHNNNNNNNNNFIYIALKSNNCPKRFLITILK